MSAFLLLLFSGVASAADWYVTPAQGKQGGAGTATDPWLGFDSIVRDGGVLAPGDSLILAVGVYKQNLVISKGELYVPGLRVVCQREHECIIDGAGKRRNGVLVRAVDGIQLSGLKMINHRHSGVRIENSSAILLQRNVAESNRHFGIFILAKSRDLHDVRIIGNNTRNNGQKRPHDVKDKSLDAGVYITAAKQKKIRQVRIIDNISVGNGRFGIILYPKSRASVTDVEIIANDTHDNGASGIDLSKDVSDAIISSNVSYSNGTNNPGAAIHLGGVKGYAVKRVLINKNIVGLQGLHRKDGAGIMVDDFVSHVTVRSNVSLDNEEAGIKLHNCSDVEVSNNLLINNPKGIHTPSADGYSILNNTIIGSAKFGLLVASTASRFNVMSNVISDGEIGLKYNSVSQAGRVIGNCLIHNRKAVTGRKRSLLSEDAITVKQEAVAEMHSCVRDAQSCGGGGVDFGFEGYAPDWYRQDATELKSSIQRCGT